MRWLWPDSDGTVPLRWAGGNIPLGLWLVSSEPSPFMGQRGASVQEQQREEIWGSFPFTFTVVLLQTDVRFPNQLLAPRFAARRDGKGNAAGLKASDTFQESCCAFRKIRTYSQTLSWCQPAETGDRGATKPVYTCWGSGPREEA